MANAVAGYIVIHSLRETLKQSHYVTNCMYFVSATIM